MSYKWLSKKTILAIHQEQISQHGGLPEIRDEGLLDSALARPKNAEFYSDATIAKCAAAYAFGIVRNHPFNDGNKRTGFIAAITFALLNGFRFKATEHEVVIQITGLAAGQISEAALVKWLEDNLVPNANDL